MWVLEVFEVHFCCLKATKKTPLCIASEKGHVEVVRALLDAGATVNQAEVSRGEGLMLPQAPLIRVVLQHP